MDNGYISIVVRHCFELRFIGEIFFMSKAISCPDTAFVIQNSFGFRTFRCVKSVLLNHSINYKLELILSSRQQVFCAFMWFHWWQFFWLSMIWELLYDKRTKLK